MIFKGSIEPSNFKLGSTQLSKICKGLATLWENWKHMTGHYTAFNSNTTPSGFTLTTTGSVSNAYRLFDANSSTYAGLNYSKGGSYATFASVTLKFPKEIKVKKIKFKINNNSNWGDNTGSNGAISLQLKGNNVHSWTVTGDHKSGEIVKEFDIPLLVDGIFAYAECWLSGWGNTTSYFYDADIIEWYEK